jgi:hypothetical protein
MEERFFTRMDLADSKIEFEIKKYNDGSWGTTLTIAFSGSPKPLIGQFHESLNPTMEAYKRCESQRVLIDLSTSPDLLPSSQRGPILSPQSGSLTSCCILRSH